MSLGRNSEMVSLVSVLLFSFSSFVGWLPVLRIRSLRFGNFAFADCHSVQFNDSLLVSLVVKRKDLGFGDSD